MKKQLILYALASLVLYAGRELYVLISSGRSYNETLVMVAFYVTVTVFFVYAFCGPLLEIWKTSIHDKVKITSVRPLSQEEISRLTALKPKSRFLVLKVSLSLLTGALSAYSLYLLTSDRKLPFDPQIHAVFVYISLILAIVLFAYFVRNINTADKVLQINKDIKKGVLKAEGPLRLGSAGELRVGKLLFYDKDEGVGLLPDDFEEGTQGSVEYLPGSMKVLKLEFE